MKVWNIIATGLLCLLLLASCGGSFAYNRLDWLIPWYVDAYVDLTSEQRQSLREQVTPLLQWHRREELARYQQILQRIEAELEHPLTISQLQNWADEMLLAVARTEETMLELALEFGATISDAQMAEFIQSLNEKQDEYEEEFLTRTDKEYFAENTKHLKNLLKRFLGRLNAEQKQRLVQGTRSLQRFDALWLNDRRQWLQQLEPLLARKPGWQEEVRTAYRERKESRPAKYQQTVDYNTRVIRQVLVEVLNSRTTKQQSSTRRELKDLQNTLQKLINGPRRGAQSVDLSAFQGMP